MRVAVLGTGIMGAGMAQNAAKAHDVVVWNRSREKAEATGLEVAGTPQEAATGADVVLTILRDLDAVRETVDGLDFGDAVWMQSSTVGLGIEELAGVAERLGATLVDAPVLGTASRLKLVVNSWIFDVTEATAETVSFAQAAGVDPQAFLDLVSGGPLDLDYLQMKAKAILAESFEPQFKLEGAAKDVALIRELAARSGLELAVIDAAARRFGQAIDAGHADEDMSAVWYATRRAG